MSSTKGWSHFAMLILLFYKSILANKKYPTTIAWSIKDTFGDFSLLAAGRITVQKNGARTLQRLIRFYQKHGNCPTVLWAGKKKIWIRLGVTADGP